MEKLESQESREDKLIRLKKEYIEYRCQGSENDEDIEDIRKDYALEWEELLELIKNKEPINYDIAICLDDETIEALGIKDWDFGDINGQSESGEIYPPGFDQTYGLMDYQGN